jgi:hypothetical protein
MSVNSTVARARSAWPAGAGRRGGGGSLTGLAVSTTEACRPRGMASSSISQAGQNSGLLPLEPSSHQMATMSPPTSR